MHRLMESESSDAARVAVLRAMQASGATGAGRLRGLAGRHFAEIARVLVAGGDLVILNFSYRDDFAADRADLEQLARAWGFSLARAVERPCVSWDAPAFHLVKRASPAAGQQ
ncbi:MAG TPA: hypothetical protein VHE11_08570, partial [Steroidobacteraceae bacterium]|nr:hypothetical protein [Steroidobacteraceae bacterium]